MLRLAHAIIQINTQIDMHAITRTLQMFSVKKRLIEMRAKTPATHHI